MRSHLHDPPWFPGAPAPCARRTGGPSPLCGCVPCLVRNADAQPAAPPPAATPPPPAKPAAEQIPPLAELERQFNDVIRSFDKCIAKVMGNIPTYEKYLAGPLVILGERDIRKTETKQARNDRARLLKRWAESKSDAERWELVTLARRWYSANAASLGNCEGITTPLVEAMIEQGAEYIHDAKRAVKDAGSSMLRPLMYVGAGIAGLVVLSMFMRGRD